MYPKDTWHTHIFLLPIEKFFTVNLQNVGMFENFLAIEYLLIIFYKHDAPRAIFNQCVRRVQAITGCTENKLVKNNNLINLT